MHRHRSSAAQLLQLLRSCLSAAAAVPALACLLDELSMSPPNAPPRLLSNTATPSCSPTYSSCLASPARSCPGLFCNLLVPPAGQLNYPLQHYTSHPELMGRVKACRTAMQLQVGCFRGGRGVALWGR